MVRRITGRFALALLVAGLVMVALPETLLGADPHDPPVSSGGEGATGDDWADFGFPSGATLYYRREGQDYQATRYFVRIAASNPHHELEHARTTAGARVSHIHFNKKYGDDFGYPWDVVTLAEGNAFWDNAYDGYTPKPSRIIRAFTWYNCVSTEYHKYKSANTQALYWVDSNADAAPYRAELVCVAAWGDNGDFDTVAGDRCDDHANHVWTIGQSNACEPASFILWKCNASGHYSWAPDPDTNDCPIGGPLCQMYTHYAIYNKVSR